MNEHALMIVITVLSLCLFLWACFPTRKGTYVAGNCFFCHHFRIIGTCTSVYTGHKRHCLECCEGSTDWTPERNR